MADAALKRLSRHILNPLGLRYSTVRLQPTTTELPTAYPLTTGSEEQMPKETADSNAGASAGPFLPRFNPTKDQHAKGQHRNHGDLRVRNITPKEYIFIRVLYLSINYNETYSNGSGRSAMKKIASRWVPQNAEESRGNAINKWFAGLQRDEEVKAAVREAKKHFQCSLQVGQIVYATWGYEQTNVDFYEVVGLKGEKTVLLRELKAEIVEHSKHAMAGTSAPLPGQFCGEVFSARAASENALKIDGRKYARLWDGRPVSCSWYA